MYEARFKALRSLTASLQATSLDTAIAEARLAAREQSDGDEKLYLTEIVNRATGEVIDIPAGESLAPPGEIDVTWSVRVPAGTALEAASLARLMQFDPTSLASVYRTRDSNGQCQVIDLQATTALIH